MAHHTSRVVVEAVGQFEGAVGQFEGSSFTCISVSQSLIYLGTRQGSLFVLSYSPDPVHENLSLLRSLSLGSSPVDVIFVLTGIGMLLILCDGSLFFVDSLLTQAARRLGLFKGASAVGRRFRGTRSVSTDLVANSATSLKGQRLYEKLGGPVWANGTKTNESELHREGAYVFAISVGKRLLLIELVNESFVVLQEMPCIDGVRDIVWLDDSIFIGTMHGYSLFSCVTGQSGVIFSFPDSCNRPLLKLLQREERLLLLVDNVGVIVDAHGQPVGDSLVFHRAPESVAELSSYIVAAGDGKMDLYHKKSGACIQTMTFGIEGVGPCVVAVEETEPGKVLAVAMPEKVVCYQKVHSEEQIKDLLRKKNFKEAVALMEELKSEGELSKEMLSFVHAQVGFLLLFDLHFEEAVNHFLQSETMQPSEIFPFIMPDPNRWSLLVPRNRYWGLHPPPMPLEDVVDDGLMAIQRAIFLRKAGIETFIDENSLQSPPTRSQLLKSAIENMIRFLEISRCKDVTLAVKEGIDTHLMYLYRALNRVYDMEKLASSPNSCIVEELEALLDGSGHLRTLAFLYASKGKVSKALTIWRTLARNYSFGLWKEQESDNTDKGCLDLNENVMSGREIAATEAAKILEDSSDECLVLQHLGWIADIKPILAIQVLTSQKRTKKLSPDEVIAAIDPKNVEIYQRYLQWLIEDQDSNDSRIHTLYALSLSKLALEVFDSKIRSKSPYDRMGEQFIAPKGSIFQNSVRERLQMFLESSDLYDPEEVLDLIEVSELWLEKAILYRKLGQETMVLHILALKLRDGEAAEQYCAEIGRPEAYMKLLDMYLDPEDGKEPMFNAAVRLLHNHGESLDPLQVLERLSPDMPLQLASDTILRMLRARFHHYREGQIVHNLSRAVHVDARLGRLEERSRNVQINDESLCDSCRARLGTKLFAMYPDDTIVCYKCFRRLGESNSVSGRNFKQDILFKTGWLVGQ